jgi:hypothetical protein
VPNTIDEWCRIEIRQSRYFRINGHRPYMVFFRFDIGAELLPPHLRMRLMRVRCVPRASA